MKKFFLLLLTLVTSVVLHAQVTIIPPSVLTVSGCSFPTPYYSAGDIRISEQSPTDFSVGGDFILSAPPDFEFEPGTGSIATTGGDLSVSNLVIDANTISFTITVNTSSNSDDIIISGIQVRGINTASGTAGIFRTGGSAVVTGDEIADGINHGSLASSQYPWPANASNPVDGSVCGTGTVTIAATSAGGTTIDWYDASTGGTLVGTGANFTTPSISATTIYYAEVINTTTGCVSASRIAVTASVNAIPASASNPVDGSVCGTGTVTIAATSAGGTTIDWYAASTAGILVGNGASFTTPSISATTIYYAEVRNTTTGCVSASGIAVTASVNAIPASASNPVDGSVCGTGTVTIAATSAGGTTIDWYDASTGGTLVGTGASFTTPSISATTIYYAEVRNTTTGCVSASRIAVTASVNAIPASASNPLDGSVCGTGTVTIAATSAGGTTIDWYDASTAGTLVGNGISFTTPSISATTIYYTEVRNTTTGCVSASRIAVTASVNAIPASASNPVDGSVCGTGTVTIAATSAGGTTIDWYDASTGGALVGTGASFTTPSIPATTIYYAEVRNTTTGCVSASRIAVTASVNAIPASASNPVDGSVCGTGTVTIAATSAGGTTIDWYDAATAGTLVGNGISFTTPSISATTIYYTEVRNITTGCVSATRTAVTATVNAVPAAPSGATDGARCGTGMVVISVAAPGAGLTIDWYATASGGSALAGGAGTSNFTTPSISTTTIYYTEVRNTTTGCVSATRTLVTATINSSPAAPTGATNGARCGTGAVTIFVASPGAALTIDWYAAASGGAVLAGGTGTTSFTTPSIATTTIYYAEVRNTTTGCTSATRTAVTATVNTVPAAPTGATNNARCGTGTVAISVAAPGAGLTIDWYAAASGGAVLAGGAGTASFATPSIAATTIYYAEVRNTTTGCTSATRTAVTATVTAVPSAPTGATNGARCGTGTVAISVAAPGAGLTIDWYAAASGGAVLAGGTGITGFTTPSIATTTIYYAEVRNTTTGCTSATRTAVTAAVNAVPSAPTGATNGARCGTGTVAISVAAPGAGLTIDWYAAASGGAVLAGGAGTTGFTTPSIATTTIYYAEVRNTTTSCVSATRTPVTATINTVAAITGTLSVCEGSTTQLTGSGTPAASTPWVSASPGIATINSSGLVSGVSAGTSVITYTNSNGCNTTATVTVNPVPPTTGVAICQGDAGSLTSTAACAAGTTATAGPNLAGTGATGGGTGDAWSNATRVSANDNMYATVSINNFSEALNATQFGFAIPANATITGIQVTIERLASSSNSLQDNSLQLIKAGAAVGNNKGATGTYWGTSAQAVNYGSTSDLWGTTWTPAQINAANFGVALIVDNNNSSNRTASVDYMQISVTYTIPGTLNWYTVSSGGSSIGTGSPFNPVGVAGSGLTNTNTPGTITFYAECAAVPGCRTATNFLINPLPTVTGTLNICIGGTTQLTGSASPAATNPWVSGTPGVATISATGLVTGISAGTTVITYTNNNGCKITATVTVLQPVISGTLTVCIGGTTQLAGSGTPAAVNPWVSGTPGVATINATGLVTTVSAGSTVITYTNSIGCTATTTVTVNPDATITLTSAAGTNTQTVCINTGITSIKYAIGGSGTGATVTGLPAGLATGFSGGVFTISGAPTASGTFNYTVTANGPCIKPSLGGTIIVQANSTITRTSSSSTTAQSLCINTAIANIVYTIGSGATGATVTGLPGGVTGSISGTVFTISGTPNVSGTFSYTVTTTGPCVNPGLSGTIIVNALPTGVTISSTGSLTSGSYYNCHHATLTATNGNSGTIYFQGTTSGGTSTTGGTSPQIVTTSGTYYFRAQSSAGCWGAEGSVTETILPLPAPLTITGGGTFCGSTTITASNGNDGTMYFQGTTGGTSTATPSSSQVITTSGTYYFRAQSTSGCWSPAGSTTVTINPLPSGSLALTETSGTPNDGIICASATVTFTATSGFNSYIFKVNGSTKQTGTSNIFSTNALVNGNTVTVDVANGFNCGLTFGPITITVNPLPAPTLIVDKNPVCSGDLVTFTAGGGTNYNFKVNGSSVQSGASNTFSSALLTSGQSVTVDVTNGNGCTLASAPVVMTVNALPTGTLGAYSTTICAGDNVIFTASGSYVTYEFKVNGVTVQGPTASNTYSSDTLTNAQVVTVIAKGSSGCSASFPGVLITVNALPAGSITATENSGTPDDNNICAGSPVTFTFNAGYSNYNFKINGLSKQNSSSNSYTAPALNNGDIVTLVVSGAGGCTATFTAPAITIIPSPTGTLSASPASICAGDNVVMSATGGFDNYNFKVNGATAQNGPSGNFSNNLFSNGDIITVDVTSNGCINTFNTVTLTVHALPTGTLIPVENSGITPNDGVICSGANVVFTGPIGFANYDFLLNGVTVQSGSSNTYSNNSLVTGDQVQVAITNASGCIGLLNTITATVNPLPVVSAITGALNVCVNSATTLADATSGGVWSSLSPAIATVDASGVVTGISAGTATINYTVYDAGGCSTVVTALVTINALPTVAPATGNVSVCENSTTQLSDATPGGTWSSDNTGVATVNSTGLVSGVLAGIANISYSVTNSNGCTTTITFVVTVKALPVVAAITTTAPSFDVCVSSTITLADATTGGTWSSGNTPVATINASGVVTGVSDGTSAISYTITTNGCATTVTQIITVHALPVPTLNGPNPICPNAIDTYTTESGQSNYNWSFTGGTLMSGGTVNDNSITIKWDLPGARTIFVNYQNAFGCTGATSATVSTSTGTVPTLSGPAALCLNSSGTYTTQTGQTNYSWIVSGGTITSGGTPTDNTATVNWLTSGAGSVSINFTDGGGCLAAVQTILTVAIHPLPSVVTHDQTVCSPATVNLTAAAVTVGSTAGLTYTYWTDAAATISYATPASAGAGTYYIKGTTAAGCSDIQPVTVVVNPTPTVVITNPVALCSPSTADITLAAVTTGSTAGLSFTYWTNAAATISYSTPATTGAGTYYIKGTTVAGCYDVQPVTVTVNPIPAVVIHNPAAICAPGTADLTTGAITSGSTAGLTFTYWTDAAATSVYSTPATAGTGIYYIKGTTAAGCYDIKPVTVTVNPTPTVVISNPVAVCTGSTVNLTLAAITSGSTAGLTFTYFTDAAATISYATPATAGAGTYYIKGTTAAGCSDIKPVMVTVNPSPTVIVSNPAAVCSPSTVNLTAAGVTAGSTAGLSFTYWTNATATISYPTPSTAGAGTYYIKGTTALGCSDIKPVIVTVNPSPAIVVTNPASVCAPATVNLTSAGVTTGSTTGLTYSYWTDAAATISYPTPAAAGAGTYYIKGTTASGCYDIKLVTATVYSLPATPGVTPVTATICQGSILPLSAGTVPTTSSVTFSSGTINLAIPDVDGSTLGVASTIAVSGIPAGAVINSISVNFNITHTFDDDLKINLKAPNNKVLNLANSIGLSGDNFTNTTISSAGVTSIIGASAPFTGIYKAGGTNNVVGATIVPGNTSNVTSFASLFSTPNGNWIFSARDVGTPDVGTIDNWSITINYSVAAVPQAVTWSPMTDLYTDPGATTAYAGQSLSTVYTKPSTPGTKVYTATATNATGCTSAANVTLTVNPVPVVTIFADYCVVAGKVRLTATSTPAGATYVWNTGQAGSSIDVDIADDYTVVASFGTGCSSTATISVANELVVNGDFSAGNTGFTSPPLGANQYLYVADGAGTNELLPEGLYGIGPDAHTYHGNFWGHDHTTGSGNFMIINGFPNGNPQPTVWQETVSVLPNTTYYFSAWGMSINSAGPFAQLQFNVNGAQVGSSPVLPAGVNSNSNNGWTRFYGTMITGPTTTTAIISITDLQNAPGGNDFGLDDISFGTLSTFVELESAPGTDAQTPCINTAITPIVYSVGSTAAGPTITGLPPGLITSFNGVLFTISGTPTATGNYAYTITTTGTCNPSTATGTINIQGQKITLTSGSGAPMCVNTSMPNIVYTLSGTATGATISGLPAGITGTLTAGNTFTLSGTPTATGTFNYLVATTGTCKPDTALGTITVQSQTITLNSANNTQTVCINTPIVNIQYLVGGTATSASVSGLPPGVTGIFNSGFFIISGTPASAAGNPYNYTVTTSGSCGAVTATGTINVTPAASLTLTSAAGTNAQTVCSNDLLTPVTYTVNNGTSVSITSGALPPGVTGSFSGGVFTISGTPTAGGVFNYTITTSGGCSSGMATGSITVQSQTVTLTTGAGSPSLCANTLMTDIVYTIGGTATSAIATGLPAGLTGSLSGNVFTISGTPTGPAGPYPYTVATSGGCGSGIANGTITVLPAPLGGTVASVLICGGSSGNITLSGNSPGSTVQRWEFSTDGGATWTTLFNTTITQSYSTVIVPTMYRAVVSSNGCNQVYSSIATLNIHNLWTGGTSTDWNTASNWSGNALPSMSCPDVYIPGGTTYQPTLSAGTAAINNLHIAAGGTLTINSANLQIAGNIFNSGIFMAANGTIELNGSAPQTIPANTFQNNALNHLIISNTNATGVTLGGALDIYGSLTYTAGGQNLNTNDVLTLKSTSSNTAWIGNMTGHTINGQVTVERFIGTGTTHVKSWQLLAIPTTGQTIKQSWEEGATASNVGNTPAGNPNPGYGTMLTSDVAGAASQPAPGFDVFTATGPSIKIYNTLTEGYNGPVSTAAPIYNQKGYFILVRGNRSIFTAFAPANPTVLRTKGTLFTPANLPPSTSVAPGKFESVGNPYASAIDLRNLSLPAGINSTIIVWDPTLGGINGLGAFQTLYLNGGNYVNLLTSVAYGTAGTTNNNIQSGQAFLIQALPASGGTMSFTEGAKTSGSSLLLRPQAPAGEKQAQLRTNLYGVSAGGNSAPIDATLIQYNDGYSNSIDGMDARKMTNTGENLGIKTGGKLLAIERRHTITQQDTIFLNLSGVRVQAYQFELVANNLNTGVEGYLEDNYLHTRTALDLSGSTVANFTIENIAGSYAADRFRIVFSPAIVLPVTFTSVKAYRRDKDINVEWKVDNEMNIKQYEVEKSTNGTQFTTLAVKAATANGGHSAAYAIADVNPVEGYNYYRVKSVDINGKTEFTGIVKVQMGSLKQDITIYPNPITDGMIHLQLMNQPAGKYGVRLLNKLGQVILSREITHAEGSSTEFIKWDYNLAHGIYQLEVTRPDREVKDISVMY